MKSGKQKRQELDARRKAKVEAAKAAEVAKRKAEAAARRRHAAEHGVPVNGDALKPHNSYGNPDFVELGFYVDRRFSCVDCSKIEIWTATQQKWWYEVAKGDVFTIAHRCRACRRKERERKTEARRVHLEGLAKKKGEHHSEVRR